MNQIRHQFLKTIIKSCSSRQLPSLQHAINFSSNISSNEALKKKRKTIELKITLITEGDKMNVVTMEQAKKLADKRQLKLVNIVDFDSKSSRPIYKLMTTHEYHAEDMKRREEKKIARNTPQIKSEKLLTVNSKITEHDLESKKAKVKKWIEKHHEVRVVISSEGDMKKAEDICTSIEKAGKEVEGRLLQKRVKDGTIRFSIMPDIKKEKAALSGGGEEKSEKKLLEPSSVNIQQVRNAN